MPQPCSGVLAGGPFHLASRCCQVSRYRQRAVSFVLVVFLEDRCFGMAVYVALRLWSQPPNDELLCSMLSMQHRPRLAYLGRWSESRHAMCVSLYVHVAQFEMPHCAPPAKRFALKALLPETTTAHISLAVPMEQSRYAAWHTHLL
jgi:hypothetical protein